MKSILSAFLAIAFFILALRAGITPWRLVTQAELDEMQEDRAAASASKYAEQSASTKFSTSWRTDPKYRTPLEKTTGAGAPEVKSRD